MQRQREGKQADANGFFDLGTSKSKDLEFLRDGKVLNEIENSESESSKFRGVIGTSDESMWPGKKERQEMNGNKCRDENNIACEKQAGQCNFFFFDLGTSKSKDLEFSRDGAMLNQMEKSGSESFRRKRVSLDRSYALRGIEPPAGQERNNVSQYGNNPGYHYPINASGLKYVPCREKASDFVEIIAESEKQVDNLRRLNWRQKLIAKNSEFEGKQTCIKRDLNPRLVTTLAEHGYLYGPGYCTPLMLGEGRKAGNNIIHD
ncbi:hypothetical protein K438DRAFT_1747993 [Mycena galopus ATCC 62051]|nr:hypothetical protein K438DRAFT_1747993 [Mycena galopus ATCC 62051]